MKRLPIFLLALLVLGFGWLYSRRESRVDEEIAAAKQQAAEKVCEKARHAISRFEFETTRLSEHEAKVALDEADENGLNPNAFTVLSHYHADISLCALGDQPACRRIGQDSISAIHMCVTAGR